MTTSAEERKEQLLKKVITHARERLPNDEVATAVAFIRQYYKRVAPDDLVDRDYLNLYGAAISQLHQMATRRPDERLVRVYNPNMESHGWQSTHTVIEVVHRDMPFLVESIRMLLNRHARTVHLIIHPVFPVVRDSTGRLQSLLAEGATDESAGIEAVMHFEVDRQSASDVLETLENELHGVLDDIDAAVSDWDAMQQRLDEVIARVRETRPPVATDDFDEDLAFLDWLADDHFTFLGFREYRLVERDGEDQLESVADTGLGILRHEPQNGLSGSFARLPAAVRRQAREPTLLVLTKSDSHATVHRPVYMDYIGIKQVTAEGEVLGEWRFLGLYTSAAYNRSPSEIPLLRRKVRDVLDCSGLRENSHSSKALLNILETLPRGELFQSCVDELCHTAMGILHLQERQRVRMFVRRDPFQRYLACLVYLPREGYDTQVRLQIQQILREAFNAHEVDFSVQLTESVLARLYLIAHTEPGELPEYDIEEIEARILDASRTWEDILHEHLLWEMGEAKGNRLFAHYRHAFPSSYRDDYPPAIGVLDLQKVETLRGEQTLGMALYKPLEIPANMLRFKLFRRGSPLSLSLVLPMLENMGVSVVDQRPYKLRPSDDEPTWIQDIGLAYDTDRRLETEQITQVFQEAFERVWHGSMENDGFNRLVLAAHLTWREVVVLRTYCKYLLQTGFPFSQAYVERAMDNQPQIASLLVSLFTAFFHPDDRDAWASRIPILEESIQKSLDAVPRLDEDRILRRFYTLIKATLRTNYFQPGNDGKPKDYVSIKLDPTLIPDLPPPTPRYEIFVYSPRTEGVHLRGGKVARGGIRWSDRLEDFRTEIFGLMKAQMVKNAVIVPVGAKGGFVVKRQPPAEDRQAVMNEVVACYSTFVRGLLDITDNLAEGTTVAPDRVVRYDEDDPYLVVAADKGTATFSDTANAIAAEYHFWLSDAFASGGSTGYDHKKMGITARGAWESVKRHFRELGRDIQKQDFTVVGIGSMNGDVFGNGMLLSPHIKLVGAFSHREIFLDPDPDPEASFHERERMFHLARSSWNDYDPQLISEGGGVYSRNAKSIPISPQVQQALGVDAKELTPDELIKALLRAPVDLLWNGGIGTFVKATQESHEDADDRSNDSVRVDATALRCRVFGEGGNLGMTQRARIEYARNGGRVNTDFIDNSGGVDCSDHEVNIKILLDDVVKSGDLSQKQRNDLLAEMTDEVAALVLRNNYLQTQALSQSELIAPALLESHVGFMQQAEKSGLLLRSTWELPDDETLAELRAAGAGLSRPELSVLLAYSKIDLFEALLESDVCEDPYLSRVLIDYFPTPLHEKYRSLMDAHRLRPEIVATFIANNIVNRMGITFVSQLQDQTGACAPDIARAYTVARQVFELESLWQAVEELDNRIDPEHQLAMLLQTRKLASRATLWFLRTRRQPLDIATAIEDFEEGVRELKVTLPELLDDANHERVHERTDQHRAQHVPEHTALRFAVLPLMVSALDITLVAAKLDVSVITAARFYFGLGARFQLDWLRERIGELPQEEHWARLARAALRDDLMRHHATLTLAVMRKSEALEDPADSLDQWEQENRTTVDRYLQRIGEFRSSGEIDLALLSVALNEVHKLALNAETSEDAG